MADTTSPAPVLTVTVGQYSAAGSRKADNQDFYGAILPDGGAPPLKGIAIAMADGISTSQQGAVASETAVASFLTDYFSTPDSWTVQRAATTVISATNGWFHGQNISLGDASKDAGLACTFDALVLKGQEAHIFHVGDGRVGLVAGKSVDVITRDHRAPGGEGGTLLSRALGADHNVEVDYHRRAIATGDIFILTTDGVHDHVSPQDMVERVQGADTLDSAAKTIVQAALDKGSEDNLTVQLVRIETVPQASSAEVVRSAQGLLIPGALKAGDILDGFHIVRQIHSSSRSRVFLARDEDGAPVALKVLSAEAAENAAARQRFMLEEWIAGQLQSDHVLRAAERHEEPAHLSVAITYFEGQTLRQWMSEKPAPEVAVVRTILKQLIYGLRAFHRKDMLHQDVRPENVMIGADGTVKIIDFGSVYVPGLEEAAPGIAGHMPGTFQYTAPEYLTGDQVSWRSDQFALGVMAYEMLTGRLPYGADVAKISDRSGQLRLKYTPARSYAPRLPLWLDAALEKAVHPDPIRRFDALSELEEAITNPANVQAERSPVSLMARNPVVFWQTISALLAFLVLILLYLQSGA